AGRRREGAVGTAAGGVARTPHADDAGAVHLSQPRPRQVNNGTAPRLDVGSHLVDVRAAVAHVAVGAIGEANLGPGDAAVDQHGVSTASRAPTGPTSRTTGRRSRRRRG